MPENNETYSKIFVGLVTALNKFSLYPPAHPVIKNTLKEIYSELAQTLNSKKELTFSLSPENKVLIEGLPVVSSASGLLNTFASEFKKLQAESITFCEGLNIEEVEFFLKAMLVNPEELKKRGGINQVLADNNIGHIKVNLFSYVKVEKDKEMVAVDKERLQPDDVIKKLDMLGASALKDAKGKDVKLKIEQAKAIVKFSSRLKKLASQLEEKGQSEKLKAIIDEKTGGYTDEILIDALAAEYAQKKAWSAPLKNIIRKFFPASEDKNRISPALKSRLAQCGLSQEESGNFILQMGNIAVEEPEAKSGIKAGGEELARLKDENAGLKSTLENLRGELADFSELKRQHKLVVDEKERVENIIRHMAEGLVVIDSQGKVLLMNPAAEKLLSVKKEESAGRPLAESIKDEHLLAFAKDLTPDAEGGLSKEIELLSPDESTKRVLQTSSAVVENQDGKTVGMVTVLNDITRQKEVEKLKTDFVANVSHELRTPLVVIQQSLSILANEIQDKLNEDQKKFLGNSQTNLDRLRSLINDLLDMASIEAGKFKLKLGLFDINEVACGVVSFLERWAKAKNINLQAQLLPVKTEFLFDKDRIIQAITNLTGNAIKFTPEGGTITVALAQRAPDENFKQPAIEVSVIDSGYGIEAADIEKIFKKFEQVSSAQQAGVRGTGLGLTITKEIIQMHGGKIWAESEVGKGSKFSFLLPMKQEVSNG